MQRRWPILLLLSSLVGMGCVNRTSHAAPVCEHVGLAAAVNMLGPPGSEQRAREAAQALVDHCELPGVEPHLRLFYLDQRAGKLPPFEPWAKLREATCPGWSAARIETATLPEEAANRHIWDVCHYERTGLASFEEWVEGGAGDLPFVVLALLRQAQVETFAARTLASALVQQASKPDGHSET